MEGKLVYAALIVITSMLVLLLWKATNLVWVKPKKIERLLRNQGINGTPYKPFLGDVKEIVFQSKAALQKPINLSDNHVSRLIPFLYHYIQNSAGKNCFIWMGPIPWLIITDPEKVKDVLTRHEDFQKPNHPLTKLLMVGLFGLEGETWAKHRRIINPAFHVEKLKNMFGLMYECVNKMITSWEDMVPNDGSVELDVWPYFEILSGDVISSAAFGSNYEEAHSILDLLQEQAHLSFSDPQPSNYIPGWSYLPTKKNRRVNKICKEIDEGLTRMIDTRKGQMEAGEATRYDLLSVLLESNMREIKEHGKEKGKGLTTKEVVQECKLFHAAGSDTTLSLLVWALVELCQHPVWQDRARAEVLQTFGKNGKPDFERLSHLKIINMILNEILRFYTPAYMLLRKVYKDVQLQELMIPAGTELVLPLCYIHQDCSLWGEDAKEFNPERFAEGVSKATKGRPIYFPFSIGPRYCVGNNFSLLEARLALTMILQRFSFQLSPTYVHAPHGVLTVKPQHGANLILRKI